MTPCGHPQGETRVLERVPQGVRCSCGVCGYEWLASWAYGRPLEPEA